jgi:hypothetical protein
MRANAIPGPLMCIKTRQAGGFKCVFFRFINTVAK